jgi:hypothetical protein
MTYQLIFILLVFLILQGCADYPSLTIEHLKGSAIKVHMKKIAQNQPQACAEIKPFQVPVAHYTQAAQQAGILPDDFVSLSKTVTEQHVTISVRDVNQSCEPYLRAGYPSKGHDVLTKTFTEESLPPQFKYLAGTVSTLEQKPKAGEQVIDPLSKRYFTRDGNVLTCDYDLMDVARADGQRVEGESEDDLLLRQKLNQNLPWRGQPAQPVTRIMHGAQAEYSNYLRARAKQDVIEQPLLWLNQPEYPLTVFSYNGEVFRLPTVEDVLNFYRCQNIVVPAEWNIQY